MSLQHQQTPKGPPYRPQTWALGGQPTVSVDIPITAVFLFLFICGAVTHMTIFQLNKKRGHNFLFNALLFGFCMARITTSVLRIASICLPTDIPLNIAANIFVAAGVVLIYVINLFFTQRIIRAQHPRLGWHKLSSGFFISIYVLIVITLIMLITVVVQGFYTLNPHIHNIDRAIQLYGLTCYAIIAFLPVLLIALSLIIPRKAPVDKFGSGRLRHNIAIVLTGSAIIGLGAAYRCGINWKTPVPRTQPLPGYFSRACFYVFNFAVEIVVVYFYALLRVDKRFHVPDGAKGAGSYARGREGLAVQDKNSHDSADESVPQPGSFEKERQVEIPRGEERV